MRSSHVVQSGNRMESNTWETYTVISGVSLPDNPESMLLVTMVNSLAGTVTAIYFQVQQQSRNECPERWCNFYFWTDGEVSVAEIRLICFPSERLWWKQGHCFGFYVESRMWGRPCFLHMVREQRTAQARAS